MIYNQVKQLLLKELTIEFRQRYAISGILLYVISTVFVCYLSFKVLQHPPAWSALFWIIVLFASVNAVTKSFATESKGRMLYYYSLFSPRAVIIAKSIYNVCLVVVLSLISLLLYSLFLGSLVQNMGLFLLVTILGASGFALVLTLMSAIASKAGQNFSLMAILSFPVMMPLLITIIRISKQALDGLAWSVSYNYLLVLLMLNVVVFALSYLLFPYLWKE